MQPCHSKLFFTVPSEIATILPFITLPLISSYRVWISFSHSQCCSFKALSDQTVFDLIMCLSWLQICDPPASCLLSGEIFLGLCSHACDMINSVILCLTLKCKFYVSQGHCFAFYCLYYLEFLLSTLTYFICYRTGYHAVTHLSPLSSTGPCYTLFFSDFISVYYNFYFIIYTTNIFIIINTETWAMRYIYLTLLSKE